MKKRKRAIYLLGFLTLVLLCFLYTALSIRDFSQQYFETESDVAIVLGAGTADGKLSQVYEQRVLHAITLLNGRKVKHIILTGGYGAGQSVSDAKAAQNYAIKKGVPESQLLIEEESIVTFFNIKHAKDIMEQKGFTTALIVSDPYHMKRAMHMCGLFGLEALPSPTPTTMYRSRNTKFNFLLRETWNYWGYILVSQHRKR